MLRVMSTSRTGNKFQVGEQVQWKHTEGEGTGEILAIGWADEFEYVIAPCPGFLLWESELEKLN